MRELQKVSFLPIIALALLCTTEVLAKQKPGKRPNAQVWASTADELKKLTRETDITFSSGASASNTRTITVKAAVVY